MFRSTIRVSIALAALAWLAGPAQSPAQVLTVGNSVTHNGGDGSVADVRTDIDLVNPASATGTVDTATFGWSAVGCTNAVKIKFFRRSGDTLTLVAERGPFTTAVSNTVALAPPVSIQQGDLIGIARLINCGNPVTVFGFPTAGYVQYIGDVTGSVTISGAVIRQSAELEVQATGTATESLSRIVPVVVSTGGLFGSFFRTGVQVLNPGPGSSTISGRFVFHPSGVSGSESSDPSLLFSVAAGQTISYTDILATMGQSGVGSMDLILPAGSQVPVITVRVYNDAGAAGTSGFTEDLVEPGGSFLGETLFAGVTGYLIGPADAAHFRYNIGVRSLFSGVFLTVTERDASGATVRAATQSFPPTYLVQVDAAAFLGGPLGNNHSLQISVSDGSAIIYGATADNTTNDPSIEFARGVFAIAAHAPPVK
jgi:hypothetical protein